MGVGNVADVSKAYGAPIFYPEDGGSMYFRNFDNVANSHMVLQPKNRISIIKYRENIKLVNL
jgi:hypothetical protein